MPGIRRALVIYNPASGRGQAVARLKPLLLALSRCGFEPQAVPTKAPGHVTELAAGASRDGCDVVLTLGGDGTLREAAAGLMGSRTALAPLPVGTTNVIAGALGIPTRLKTACELLGKADAHPYDVGLCDQEPFLMQASAGLDGRALKAVDPGLKSRLGKAAVGMAGLAEWWRYDYPRFEVRVDDRLVPNVTFFAACNLAQYAGRKSLIPMALPNDGRLDYLLFTGQERWDTLQFTFDFLRSRHVQRDDVEVGIAQNVEVSFVEPVVTQVDGDVLQEKARRSIRMAKEVVRMLIPNAGLVALGAGFSGE